MARKDKNVQYTYSGERVEGGRQMGTNDGTKCPHPANAVRTGGYVWKEEAGHGKHAKPVQVRYRQMNCGQCLENWEVRA